MAGLPIARMKRCARLVVGLLCWLYLKCLPVREDQGSFMSDEVSNVVPVEPVAAPTVKITVRPNGPLRVEGPISLVDVNGNEWDLTGKPAISLCRCGMSSKRPFCDGTHGREGWKCEASPIPTEPVALG
jgi:CDGSH-type Zn-finger protein